MARKTGQILAEPRQSPLPDPLIRPILSSGHMCHTCALHHQFRALTSMSPLQYQKQIRLQGQGAHANGRARHYFRSLRSGL